MKQGDCARPVSRLALRGTKRNGQKCHALLLPLDPREVLRLLRESAEGDADPRRLITVTGIASLISL